MTPREIAGTGVLVSPLGLGTVKFGRNQQVKYPEPFDLPSDAEIHRLLDIAQENNVTYLDTAPAYGSSEERLGKILSERSTDQPWTISTKAGEYFNAGLSSFDFTAPAIRSSVETSLLRLKRNQLDLVLIHSDGQDRFILEQTDALQTLFTLRDQGYLRATGISTKTTEGGILALKLGVDAVMATYNPWYQDEAPVLAAAAEMAKSVLIKKGLSSGWAGRSHDIPVAEQTRSSFEFIFAHPGVTSVVVGTIQPAHLQGNAEMVAQTNKN